MKRKIAVVTGTRAEYGILYPVLKAMEQHPKLQLLLVATGMHLSHEFGYTVQELEKDGFRIDAEVDMLLPYRQCRNPLALELSGSRRRGNGWSLM
jgi:GDP/UDP-N,N'-diacetylbacillosamine 2-epimerase (hydrolysing)